MTSRNRGRRWLEFVACLETKTQAAESCSLCCIAPLASLLLLPAVRKGSDNAAKQSTHKVVTAAKALKELLALISMTATPLAAATAAAAPGGASTAAAGTSGAATAAATAQGAADRHHHHHGAGAGVGLGGSLGAGQGAGVHHAHVEAAPVELAQPTAWHAKNTLVRDALREISHRQNLVDKERQEKAATAASAAAATAATGGSKAGAAEGEVAAMALSLAAATPAAQHSDAAPLTGVRKARPPALSPLPEPRTKARRTENARVDG